MEKFMGGEEQEKKENSGYGERLRDHSCSEKACHYPGCFA